MVKKTPNPSSASSSHTYKLNQRIWEIKSKLVMKRLMDLNKINEGFANGNGDKRIICYTPREISVNDLHSRHGASSSSAMERAEEIQDKLPLNSPSFLKYLLRSHVLQGFWLGLPKQFCVAHLPKTDEYVILVVENEEKEYKTKYLAEKCGLSGGWKGFSIAHKLVERDVCVFELIEQCKWKVHIVRASPLTELTEVVGGGPLTEEVSVARTLSEVNAARSLINLHARPIETVKMDESHEDPLKKNGGVSDTIPLKSLKQSALNHKRKKRNNNPDDDDEEQYAPVITSQGQRFSKPPLDFKDMNTFDDFKIQVGGLILDSEIPTHLRPKYYQLCCSQRRFLHENLMKGLNGKLASGMISEMITIADAIQAAKPSTDRSDLERYDKTLKAFEDLGMVVGFLRARIDKLLKYSREMEEKIESKRNARNEVVDFIRGLKMSLSTAKKSMVKLDEELDELTKNSKEKFVFKQIAGEAW